MVSHHRFVRSLLASERRQADACVGAPVISQQAAAAPDPKRASEGDEEDAGSGARAGAPAAAKSSYTGIAHFAASICTPVPVTADGWCAGSRLHTPVVLLWRLSTEVCSCFNTDALHRPPATNCGAGGRF